MNTALKWCKIHKGYIEFHSHSMVLLFANIFIRIQQTEFLSKNMFIYILRNISYSRIYSLTFTGCIHSHLRSKFWLNIHSTFSARPLRIIGFQHPLFSEHKMADEGI